jgi:hypothetical protein
MLLKAIRKPSSTLNALAPRMRCSQCGETATEVVAGARAQVPRR